MEKGCDQRSRPAKAGAGELGAPRQKASPNRNVAKHLATRPSHRSPAPGTTRSAQAPRRSDRSELQRPVRGPPGVIKAEMLHTVRERGPWEVRKDSRTK